MPESRILLFLTNFVLNVYISLGSVIWGFLGEVFGGFCGLFCCALCFGVGYLGIVFGYLANLE